MGEATGSSGAAKDRAADDGGLRARSSELDDVLRRADAARGQHGEARGGDLGRPARGRAPRACRRGRSPCRARGARRPRDTARPPAPSSARPPPSSPRFAPCRRCTSSATTSCSPSAAAHGAGIGERGRAEHDPVGAGRRAAPGRPRASGSRRRPVAAPERRRRRPGRTSSGRGRPLRAPSRSTRWIRDGARRRERGGELHRVARLLDDLVVVARWRRTAPSPRTSTAGITSIGASSHSDSTPPC